MFQKCNMLDFASLDEINRTVVQYIINVYVNSRIIIVYVNRAYRVNLQVAGRGRGGRRGGGGGGWGGWNITGKFFSVSRQPCDW